ncbi:V-type ATP synthase subunit I [Acholeplasma granularum]|uniref:V-type ATP synthase subunit I n=1 Tax=Acholeplasma granularum TaxID=264635 RepID=UPI0004725C2C|nr:V-type ATP synthase subunit I [Acholeplasma granularum]
MIVSMNKVKLFFMEDDQEAILNELQLNALFMPDKKHFRQVNPSEDLIKVSKAISIVEKYIKKPMGNNETVSKLTFEKINEDSLLLVQEIIEKQDLLFNYEDEKKNSLLKYKDLLPYKDLNVSEKRLNELRFTKILIGKIAIDKFESFKGQMDSFGAFVELISTDDNFNYLAIICDIDQKDQLTSLLETNQFIPKTNELYEKSNVEMIHYFNESINNLENNIEQVKKYFEDISHELGNLKLLHDQLLSKDNRQTITFQNTKETLFVEGWVRSDQVDSLKHMLDERLIDYEIEVREPLNDELIPTALKNNKFVKPFEYITNQYSAPSSREVDPNPSMSFWYWIIFGIMMGDIGYGLVMVVLFGLALKFAKLRGAMKDLVQIFFLTGITAILAGLVFASFFGLTLPFYKPILDPINDPVPMLIVSIILGVAHIIHGLILKVINSVRQKDLLGGLSDAGSWIFILVGLSVFVVATFIPLGDLVSNILLYTSYVLMGIGVLLIITLNGREQKSIAGKFVSAFTGLYNATSYLSDILSYSRILALALSTAVIAYTMNLLGTMVLGSIPVLGILLGIVIYLIGHIFNFIMGMLSAYVHAGRLQYLEFYGKFYEGGGYLFEPLQLQLKYVYQVNLKENNKNNKEIN